MDKQELPYKLNQLKFIKIMKNLVYAHFEGMTVNEVSELMRIASEKMAIKVASATPTLFRVSAYGIFDGDAEDWGFESADCGLFQGEEEFEATKKLYETKIAYPVDD